MVAEDTSTPAQPASPPQLVLYDPKNLSATETIPTTLTTINDVTTINYNGTGLDGLAVAGDALINANVTGEVVLYTNSNGIFTFNYSFAGFDPTALGAGPLQGPITSEAQSSDLVVVDGNHALAYVYFPDPMTGRFNTPNASYPVQANPQSVLVIGDFEGTGFNDVAVLNGSASTVGQVTLLSNTGNGTFRTPTNFDVGLDPTGMVVQTIPGLTGPTIAVSNALSVNGPASPSELQINLRQLSALRSNGVAITGSSGGNLVEGNSIGVDIEGNQGRGNASDGVLIDYDPTQPNAVLRPGPNTIGGTAQSERNVISGNNSDGVQLVGAAGGQSSVSAGFDPGQHHRSGFNRPDERRFPGPAAWQRQERSRARRSARDHRWRADDHRYHGSVPRKHDLRQWN